MKIRIKLFDLYIFLIALLKGFGLNSNNSLYVLGFALGCIVILTKMFYEKYSLKEFIPLVIIVVIGFLNFVLGGTTAVLFTAVTICGLKNVDLKRSIKISFWVRVIAFITMLILYALGIIDESPYLFFRDGVYIVRHRFGYGHPNIAHFMLATIVLHGLYLYSCKMNLLHFLGVFLVNLLFYCFTYSRTGFFAIMISLLLFYLIKKPRLTNGIMNIGRYTYVLIFLFTILTALNYGDNQLIDTLNDLLTGRIYYNNLLLTSFTPPLLGSSFYSEHAIIDNGVMVLLYEGGLLAFVWFSYYLIKLANKLYHEGQKEKLSMLICFLIYNLTESFLISVSVNISLLFIQEVIFVNKEEFSDGKINNSHTCIQPKVHSQATL